MKMKFVFLGGVLLLSLLSGCDFTSGSPDEARPNNALNPGKPVVPDKPTPFDSDTAYRLPQLQVKGRWALSGYTKYGDASGVYVYFASNKKKMVNGVMTTPVLTMKELKLKLQMTIEDDDGEPQKVIYNASKSTGEIRYVDDSGYLVDIRPITGNGINQDCVIDSIGDLPHRTTTGSKGNLASFHCPDDTASEGTWGLQDIGGAKDGLVSLIKSRNIPVYLQDGDGTTTTDVTRMTITARGIIKGILLTSSSEAKGKIYSLHSTSSKPLRCGDLPSIVPADFCD